MAHPDVLIAAHDAAAYVPLLEEMLGGGTRLSIATTAAEALNVYDGQAVVLGEPDLLAGVLDDMPAVEWVQSSWAGVTPLLKSDRKDFQLTGIKDAFGSQMSDYVFAYLLAREVKILERLGRQSRKSWWDEPSGSLQGKTLGVMGTGYIGSAIALRAKAFGMKTVGFSRTGQAAMPFDQVYASHELEAFLPQPDYLVAVLPDTPETRGLLGSEAFALMKNSCYLVNVGRGSLIDEQALIKALHADELAGAVLDVFQVEPLAEDSALWHAPNLLVTGHIAAISRPRDISRIFSENYRRYCNGEPLNYLVDFDRGY
jgi:phosphoglycerate dehydrogenase-like enzyme